MENVRWLIKAMREFFFICSLSIISCSHNLLFCSHKKDILFPQHTTLFPQRIILFPQYIILFPQHITLFPQYIIDLFPQHIILFPQCIILASVVGLSISPLLTFHSKTFSSETTGPIRTKLDHHSPWAVPFKNCVQQVRVASMMSSSGAHSLTLDPMGNTFKDLLLGNCLVNWK